MSEQIKVQYVNAPKPGKTNGSVKTEDGRYLGVHPEMLHRFKQGGTYTVDIKSREWQGKTYYNIQHLHDDVITTPTPAGQNNVPASQQKDTARQYLMRSANLMHLCMNAAKAVFEQDYERELAISLFIDASRQGYIAEMDAKPMKADRSAQDSEITPADEAREGMPDEPF